MTQTAIVVHRSKSKMIRLFLGALVFVALGALITKVIYDEQGAGAFRVFIGLFTMLFFGVFAIAGLVKLLDKRPALEFLNEGLLARDISATPIRWEDIEAARLLTYRQRPVIELMLSPLAEQTLPFTKTVRFTRESNRGLGFQGVCLNAAELDIPPDTLIEMIAEWALRAQPAVTARPGQP
ncbi:MULTISPECIES: STM3941 family protein [Pararhizobium]|uniref:STM3941 family protein n=1 Tax=Pararhizobium TaxID=1612611 RepID=UPI0023E17291|nr:STM3941 family protein [Pararhizobium qamdonense]